MRKLACIPIALSTMLCIANATPTVDSINHGLAMTSGVSPGSLVLEWWGIDEHVYFIQHSEDLMNWTFLPIYELGSDGPLSWGLSMTGDRQFFRARFSDDPQSELLSADYNNGAISAWDQIQLGFNPFLWADPGENGFHDAWELHYFGTTGVDPAGDPDGDSLKNSEEFLARTDPLDPDTDKDGLLDGNEVLQDRNPLVKDHPLAAFDLYFALED